MNKKILKKLKNSIFGASKEGYFKVGEIVRWQRWKLNPESVERVYNYGVLFAIIEAQVDRRKVKIAEILPFGESETIKISLILVKKSDLKD